VRRNHIQPEEYLRLIETDIGIFNPEILNLTKSFVRHIGCEDDKILARYVACTVYESLRNQGIYNSNSCEEFIDGAGI
jgi:hypothetical protein|tara:strand:- start:2021 stop:2254 length:234 start_codon:yes stop_codon:yes gene_type:complete